MDSGEEDRVRIFTFNSLARNQENLHTAFIDLWKAFDFVDRQMLFHKSTKNIQDLCQTFYS
jgi:hypothetical protein